MHGIALSVPRVCLLQHQGTFVAPESLYRPTRQSQRRCLRKWRQNAIAAKFDLTPPPYQLDALEPHMSKQTLEFHWGKHHRGYVDNLNKQILGTELDGMPLESIILATYNKGDLLPPFNNAGQIWNHDFFWQSMKPGGGGHPSGDLFDLIERDFGSYESFLNEFKLAAATQFGSGWAWLVYKANRLDVGNARNPFPSEKDNKLMVVKTPNAVNPLVWDYSNRRPDFISTFVEKLVSWEAVSSRLEKAKARAAERAREDEKRQEEDDGMNDTEAVEMYLDSENEESEAE